MRVFVYTCTHGCNCVRGLEVGPDGALKSEGGSWGAARLRGMGKRSRRRVVDVPGSVSAVWQTARVRVDDETWAEFRRLLGERSVAEAEVVP